MNLLQPEDQNVARECYMLYLQAIFWTLVGMAILGLISEMLIRELKLHTNLDRNYEAEQAEERLI